MNREGIDRRIKALNDRIVRVKEERDRFPNSGVPPKSHYKKRIQHLEKQIMNVESEYILDQLYNMHE